MSNKNYTVGKLTYTAKDCVSKDKIDDLIEKYENCFPYQMKTKVYKQLIDDLKKLREVDGGR